MTILDAYAVLALLKDETAASAVESLLRHEPTAALTALGVAEVLDHLVRLVGVDEEEAVLDLAELGLGPPLVVDADLAMRAGLLRTRRYHRRRCAISLADSVVAAAARATGRPVATSDPHLLDICAAENIAYVALADTAGDTWTPPEP